MDKPFLFVWIPRIGHNWVRLVHSLHGLFQVGVSDTIFKLYMHRSFIEDQIRLQDVLLVHIHIPDSLSWILAQIMV